MKQPLAERMKHHAAFGVTLTIPDPFLAELFASQPLDYLMVDTEHSAISIESLQAYLIGLRTSEATILVRVPHNDATTIGQALDLGADGVVVPHIDTADDCRAAVAAAYYPPLGHRGYGPRRAARLASAAAPYLASANSNVCLIVMLETVVAVENLTEILAVPGLGGVIVGAGDLAASLGLLGDQQHADVIAAIDRI